MCRYINMRFIGCHHPRTLVLYRCDSNVNNVCPAPCFRPLVEFHFDDCVNMLGKCPRCDPTPRRTQACSPSASFANRVRALGKDLISSGQWILYTEMQIAFRELFCWNLPPVRGDKLFNEYGIESAYLTTLKRDMMQELDKLRIPLHTTPIPFHAPIWYDGEICH